MECGDEGDGSVLRGVCSTRTYRVAAGGQGDDAVMVSVVSCVAAFLAAGARRSTGGVGRVARGAGLA